MFGEPVFHNIGVIAPCDLTESQSVVCPYRCMDVFNIEFISYSLFLT